MMVPKYWAEGRARQERAEGVGQITVRRFGWSDVSQEEAQSNADARATEALARIASGEKIARHEPKVPYNGAEGVPIREEIVATHGESVITRNLYGARCLNSPNIFFADIDFAKGPPSFLSASVAALLAAGSFGILWSRTHYLTLALFAVAPTLILAFLVAEGLHRLWLRLTGGPEQLARRRVERFVALYPAWHLRLYRTPAGLRVLAMHRTFDPAETSVDQCFRALGADRVYARMCANQRCFRARVGPKPWRIGINAHLRPRPGVWPIKPARMPERIRWVEAYEQVALGFASCRFLEALGNRSAVDPAARTVQLLHDELCKAQTTLPIA